MGSMSFTWSGSSLWSTGSTGYLESPESWGPQDLKAPWCPWGPQDPWGPLDKGVNEVFLVLTWDQSSRYILFSDPRVLLAPHVDTVLTRWLGEGKVQKSQILRRCCLWRTLGLGFLVLRTKLASDYTPVTATLCAASARTLGDGCLC